LRFLARLLARLGDVPGEQHAPVLAIDGLTMLLGSILGEASIASAAPASPSVDIEPSEMMPMPCLPARVMPEGLTCEATTNGISSCNGSNWSAASCIVYQSVLSVTRSPLKRRRIMPIAWSWRSRWTIGSMPSV
jgi:hypothetical protein